MQVILLQKVPGLGEADDVRKVSDGYAMNYLFPKHLAVQASPRALADLSTYKKKQITEGEVDLRVQQSLADTLDGLEIKFSAKANTGGLLYAAVTAQKISERLKHLGYTVDKKQIEVPVIKTVGEYKGKIKLRHGLETNFNILISAS